MSAGTGVMHSEFNHSKDEEVHLYQIWIFPEKKGIEPSYEQKFFADDEKLNRLRVIASPTAEDGAVKIHQDAKLYATLLEEGKAVTHALGRDRNAWIQVATGSVTVDGKTLNAGDGAAITAEDQITLTGASDKKSEVLLFDLA